MDLARLKHFYVVVKAGSFSGAGRILNMDHSTLSRSMELLEHSLKSQLLERTPRGVKVTPQGERVFKFAAKFIRETEVFLKEFNDMGQHISGEIKIVTTPALAEIELNTHLLPFLEIHPDITIKITSTLEDFDVQEDDVALRTFIPNRSDLEQIHIHTHHIKFWASKDYLQRFGIPKTAKDLDKHRLLSFKESNNKDYYKVNLTNWILHVDNDNDEPRKSFYQMTSYEGLHNAACKGYGIVQLPEEWTLLKQSPLIQVLPELTKAEGELFFIYKKNVTNSKRIRALLDHLRLCFQQQCDKK